MLQYLSKPRGGSVTPLKIKKKASHKRINLCLLKHFKDFLIKIKLTVFFPNPP